MVIYIKIKEKEMEIIRYQLGREADNIADIAVYCPFGKPAVLLTLPYTKEKGMFPTIYWLSCPYLVKEVAKLEDKGLVKEFSILLEKDPIFKEKLLSSHQRYAVDRMKLLTDKIKLEIRKNSRAMLEVLSESGVGGILEKDGVKCLHTHLADYLVKGDNPVGEMIWGRLDWPSDCYICDLDKIQGRE